jgi:hypothetical protein
MDHAQRNDEPRHGLVNPRLSDLFDLVIRQDRVPFVMPHVREDLPLSLDPFLLWQSDKPKYDELHKQLVGFADLVCQEAVAGRTGSATMLLGGVQELPELGLGYAVGSKKGSALGPVLINRIIETVRTVPQLIESGFSHVEVIALLVPKVREDRISDLTASVLLKWLVDFTAEQCSQQGIPMRPTSISSAWDADRTLWRPLRARLPWNAIDGKPVLLAPLDLLRRLPWINYDDYYESAYAPYVLQTNRIRRIAKEAVLAYNRTNFQSVERYVVDRERQGLTDCKPDPLFRPLAVDTLSRKLAQLRGLPTGRADGADKKYEDLAFDLLSSLLFPELDLAASQVRTVSGVHIRDIIFHNDSKTDFLADLRQRLDARQIVFELKNVGKLTPTNVNQLYRYLDNQEMGRLGILLSRHPPPAAVIRNTVDLYSAKRYYILCMDDRDLELMVQLIQSGRMPVEALRKSFVEFTRKLPK